ncbi:MAG TPA: MnhB domain-containing protein [Trebonia sp.]|nr:MnhB domain-containing protein [Trebonia sp.]
MTPGQRRWLFLVGVAGLVAFLGWGIAGLPAFGSYPGPYGPAITARVVQQTNATGVVSAINFEYRGFDTVGEEFILVAAVAGMSVVLRRLRGERADAARDDPSDLDPSATDPSGGRRRVPVTSGAVRMAALALTGPTVLAGWWLATHAQTSPSGGFQGGVLLATAFFLVYLSGEFIAFRRLSPVDVVDAAEAIGAGGFAAVGVAALPLGLPYLDNYLPLGSPGSPGAVTSSGTIAVISLLVGVAVAAAFIQLIGEFLEQTLLIQRRPPARGH